MRRKINERQQKKISVIVPVYNTEKYLGKCLESLIKQEYKNLEIIIVNDGSTDDSALIIDSFSAKYSNILVVAQENRGLSEARNTGIAKASGDYIAFVDSDDYVERAYFVHLMEAAEKADADMVICGYKMVDEKGKIKCEVIPRQYIRNECEEWACRIMAACFRMVKRDFWIRQSLSFWKGVWGEDIPVVLFLNSMCNKIAVASFAEYYYVQHKSSIRHKMKGIVEDKMPYKALEECCGRIVQQGCKNSKTYLELSVIKIFTLFVFDLGRGSEKDSLKRLCEYIYKIMDCYFVDWEQRISIPVILRTKFSVLLKLELSLFYILLKKKRIFGFARIYCRMFG